MPENWKTYKLGDITTWKSGGTPSKQNSKFWNGTIPWISAKTLKGRYVFDSGLKITEAALTKGGRLAPIGSLLFLVRGSGLYNDIPVAKVTNKVAYNQDIKCVQTNTKKLNSHFLLYWFKGNKKTFTNLLEATSIGAGKFDSERLFQLQFNLPPLPEQRAIASILSTLDDKIENNLAMNKTLEDMAMALYKHWFVDLGPFQNGKFIDSELGLIPEGWEVSEIGEHFEALRGLSYKGKFLAEKGEGVPMHNLNSVFEGGYYKHKGLKWYSGDYKDRHLVRPSDLIVTNTEQGFEYKLIGSPALIPECYGSFGIFSHHLYKLIPKNETHLSTLYLYYKLLDPKYRFYVTAYANGTTVNMLSKDGLIMPYLIIPPDAVIKKFTNLVSNYHQLKEENIEENKTLTKLRDILLPKLISGEVRVKDVEQLVKEVL